MRLPSLALLATRAAAVLRRFPWTLAAGVVAAAAGIAASRAGVDDIWTRLAFVAALALPATTALALLAEVTRWSSGVRLLVFAGVLIALAAFLATWNGIDLKHDAIRYFQLSAALHLAVAFLPFLGAADSVAFWQYNRRLFLGFLRAVVFSGVLFVGIAIALGALDHLFGVDIDGDSYFRIWLIVAFVVNTWIFLAAVPEDLTALAHDTTYPRALKVFAQYILTPLAFTYLVILLAYLIKIVAGGEWPSGWIGWLVASVSVTGLLGFLLVHPLRTDPDEAWIRTYARWLFIGLVPAALMLLVAFWKRIVPYGVTEPRMLGLVLGLWLLGIALLFVARSGATIRVIPVTLALVLLLTLYGPLSLTGVSITSQGRRLAAALATRDRDRLSIQQASAALQFLMDRRAADEIAARIGHELPPIDWATVPRYGDAKDSVANEIMKLVGATYIPEYARTGDDGSFYIHGSQASAVPVTGFEWMIPVGGGDTSARGVGADSVRVLTSPPNGLVWIRAGADTLRFDLRPFARGYVDSMRSRAPIPAERLWTDVATTGCRRARLMVSGVNGKRWEDSLRIDHWNGSLLLATDRCATR